MNVLKTGDEREHNQVYPTVQMDAPEIDHQLSMKYVLIMGLLFNVMGYGPRGILGAIDYQLQTSVAIYSALEILPSLCLLINLGLIFKMNEEIRNKLTSLCTCE